MQNLWSDQVLMVAKINQAVVRTTYVEYNLKLTWSQIQISHSTLSTIRMNEPLPLYILLFRYVSSDVLFLITDKYELTTFSIIWFFCLLVLGSSKFFVVLGLLLKPRFIFLGNIYENFRSHCEILFPVE